jgi:hypothetical protein
MMTARNCGASLRLYFALKPVAALRGVKPTLRLALLILCIGIA